MTPNKGRAFFALAGYNFDPAEVTRRLGIEPTRVDASGAAAELGKPVLSLWELSTDEATAEVDVYKLTEDIIKRVEPAKAAIQQLSKDLNLSPRVGVVLELSVDQGQTVPDVGFGSRTIRFLADIGAFINIDYRLSDRV